MPRAPPGFPAPCSRRRIRGPSSRAQTSSGTTSPADCRLTCRGPMAAIELSYDRARLERLRHGAVVVSGEPAVFWIEGPGALTCLQGLLTNDLEKAGDHSLVYGALLTPKGMIVVDAWVIRLGDTFTLIMPPSGHDTARELFTRSLPPRLARTTDLTGQAAVAWLLG